MNKRRKVDVYAAGAVVWRRTADSELEVLVVHRPARADWSFPKGKLKPGETMRACCIRELREEGGVDVVLGCSLGWERYELPGGKWKATHYWAARVADVGEDAGALRARHRVKLAPKSEVDKRRWVSLAQARKLLTYPGDLALLEKLAQAEQRGEIETRALVVLRHAKARKRTRWRGGRGAESDRPLTAGGTFDATALGFDLAAYAVQRIYTSPWRRCLDTVLPYARRSHLRVRRKPGLTERAYSKDAVWPQQFVSKRLYRVGAGQGTTVVCVHRPTMSAVLAAVRQALATQSERASLERKLPKSDPWLGPGEMLVIHLAKQCELGEKRAPHRRPQIVQIERVSRDFES